MRAWLAVFALLALTAGCGSSSRSSTPGAPGPGSLDALWKASGERVALIPGDSDFAPGRLRVTFLVVNGQGRVISPPRARVWVARAREDKPFEQTIARLERVGVRGVAADADVKALYVAEVSVPTPGTYYMLVRPIGRERIGALRELLVKSHSASPAVGSRAYPSQTPTLASTGGNLAVLTTRTPPDRGLLRYSIASSLASHVPFVVTFATPRYCTSRTCGPVVDVVDHVRRLYSKSRVRFIHVEIYKGNNPSKGENRWVREWNLPSEPWTFLVGRDGRIKAKFEGSLSVRELTASVQTLLS
ncbi:MAG TPA: hypothetical protein VIU81_05400 [Gaiellaceae bacterium]